MKLPVNYNLIDQRERRQARKQYIEEQRGKCYYCHAPLERQPPVSVMVKNINRDLFPKQFFKYPIHLHHNHNTGMTIGAVHARCNAVLWQYHGE